MPTGRIPAQFAYNGDKSSVPDTDSRGYVNWKDGYTADYERRIGSDLNAKALERAKYNGLLALITENLKQWQDQSFPDWRGVAVGTENIPYAANTIVRYSVNNGIYRSIQAVPAGVAPIDTTYWELVPTVPWIVSLSPMASGGGDPTKELVSATGTDLNNYGSGTWEFSPAVAAGTSNVPTAGAGMLQSKAWSVSGTNYRVQRWTSVNGSEWNRALTGSGWSQWSQNLHRADVAASGLFGTNTVTNLNAATNTGYYFFASTAANIPWGAGAGGGFLYVCSDNNGSSAVGVQIAVQATSVVSDLTPWTRHFNGSTYTAWQRTSVISNISMPAGGISGGSELITTGIDFNSIQTGTYEMTATAAAGSPQSPTPNRCMVECKIWTDGTSRAMQRVIELGTGKVFTRVFDTAWSAWSVNYTNTNKPTADDVGAVPRVSPSNWASYGVVDNVIGMLGWRNYGNGHVIFDASNSKSPSGATINGTNASVQWEPSFPTLMGWNGASTYGVRVDSARRADSAGSADSATNSDGWYLENTSATASGKSLWPISISSGDHSVWYRLCTLPATTDGTFDSVSFIGATGPWTTAKGNFQLSVGNRSGFHWSGDSGGYVQPIFGAWQQPDGTTIVAIMLNPYWTVNMSMEWLYSSGVVPGVVQWTPSGTVVWNTGEASQTIGNRWTTRNLPLSIDQYNGISFPANCGWTGNNFAQFGPNSTWGGTLIVGGGGGHTGPKMGQFRISDGTIHLDAGTDKPIWFNWESGSDVVFGNAANTEVARITKSGAFSAASISSGGSITSGDSISANKQMYTNGGWWRDNMPVTVAGNRTVGAPFEISMSDLPQSEWFVPVAATATSVANVGYYFRSKFGTYGTGAGGWDQQVAAIWAGSGENDAYPRYVHKFDAVGMAIHGKAYLERATEITSGSNDAQIEHGGNCATWKALRKIYTAGNMTWTWESVKNTYFGWSSGGSASGPQTVFMNASSGDFYAGTFNCTGLSSSYSQLALSGSGRGLWAGNNTLTDVYLYGNASANFWVSRNGANERILTRSNLYARTLIGNLATPAATISLSTSYRNYDKLIVVAAEGSSATAALSFVEFWVADLITAQNGGRKVWLMASGDMGITMDSNTQITMTYGSSNWRLLQVYGVVIGG